MLETIGFEPEMGRWARAADTALGRVVRVDRGLVVALTESGPVHAGLGGGLLRATADDPLQRPCTGDWCVLRDWPDHRTTVESLLPRRTAVIRAAADKQTRGQVLCANADLAAVVVALHPLPVVARVERLVALAWESGARPVIVLTKADLVNDGEELAEDLEAAAPDVEVHVVSARTGAGIDGVRDLLQGRLTMALLGASGHGKSSLVNGLAGAEVLATRAIREDGRGRHTSVRRELVPLPGGGAVVDTPGLRGVGLLDVEAGLARTFADVEALASQCRFRDCAHGEEPGCAVRAAISDGGLTVRRFESWGRLQRELAWAASRQEARRRTERARASKLPRREWGRMRP